jgi:hypothetical protein
MAAAEARSVTTPGAVGSWPEARSPILDWLIGQALARWPYLVQFAEPFKLAEIRSTLNFSMSVRTLAPDSKIVDRITIWVGGPGGEPEIWCPPVRPELEQSAPPANLCIRGITREPGRTGSGTATRDRGTFPLLSRSFG